MREVLTPSSGVYERRGGAQSLALYSRRFCGFTPAESLLFVAIVTMVFLQVTLVGAAGALPSHHAKAISCATMACVGGGPKSPKFSKMSVISSLILCSGKVHFHTVPVGDRADLFAGWRDMCLKRNPAADVKQPISTHDSRGYAAPTAALYEESSPASSDFSLSVPLCFQAVPRFTRLAGFGPSLDGLQPTASTPRLS